MTSPVRRKISTRKRADLFLARDGVCHQCHGKILPGEAWDVSHVIPLALGGADDESNWDLIHSKCHRALTSMTDIPNIAKAKRREASHIGAKAPSATPMPFGKKSPWKRTLAGKIVPREG